MRVSPRFARGSGGAGYLAFALAVACLTWPQGVKGQVAGPLTVAAGNLLTPFWAAASPGGLATLRRVAVPARLLGLGGPGNVAVQVPVGVMVRLRSRWYTVLRAPPGEFVANIMASGDGLVAVEAPYRVAGHMGGYDAHTWQLVVMPWFGHPQVVWRSPAPSTGAATTIPDLAVSGDAWGALWEYSSVAGEPPKVAFLLRGRFQRPTVQVAYAVGDILPTVMALDPIGDVCLAQYVDFDGGSRFARFPARVGLITQWLGEGEVVGVPGGFLAVSGRAIWRLTPGGPARRWALLPPGTQGLAVAGDAQGGAVLADRGDGRVAVYGVGVWPRGLRNVPASGLESLTLTGYGAVAMYLEVGRQGAQLVAWPVS